MPSPRAYTTAGAFRKALEERLKRAALTDQIDLNRLRRQVSFDRLLALAWIRWYRIVAGLDDRSRTAVRRKDSCLHAPAEHCKQQSEGPGGSGSPDRIGRIG